MSRRVLLPRIVKHKAPAPSEGTSALSRGTYSKDVLVAEDLRLLEALSPVWVRRNVLPWVVNHLVRNPL